MGDAIPLVVEFVQGSRVAPAEPDRDAETLPRDAHVRFEDGRDLSIPADQIVHEAQESGAARVGFGGVSFEGLVDGRLAFWRVKDMAPEELLPADRDIRFLIDPELVSGIVVHGIRVWPRKDDVPERELA